MKSIVEIRVGLFVTVAHQTGPKLLKQPKKAERIQ